MVQGVNWLNGGALVYLGVQLLRTVKAFSVDVSSERTFIHPLLLYQCGCAHLRWL